MIKPADKTGGIVVLQNDKYQLKEDRQLPSAFHYFKLREDPTAHYSNPIESKPNYLLSQTLITKSYFLLLKLDNQQPTRFYLLPKVHRVAITDISDAIIPGRPIISNQQPQQKTFRNF